MSQFLTELVVEPADEWDDGLWRLVQPLSYASDVLSQTVTVPQGFVTDFASVPRLMVAYALFGGKANEASVVHDYLYSRGNICTREQADATFKEAMKVTGVALWRANVMWAAVRLFGGPHFGKP